jgi:hypothetical protein
MPTCCVEEYEGKEIIVFNDCVEYTSPVLGEVRIDYKIYK